jgi:hypothetical protein
MERCLPDIPQQIVSTVVAGPLVDMRWMDVFDLSIFAGAEVVAANGLRTLERVYGWLYQHGLPIVSIHGRIGREVDGVGLVDAIKIRMVEMMVMSTPKLAGGYWG